MADLFTFTLVLARIAAAELLIMAEVGDVARLSVPEVITTRHLRLAKNHLGGIWKK